ncbi:alginate lyase family protein [Neolewinella aurantiaca]|uniref:Alginate lyase family protein n=1 Tax=Neolewinella aurantiaca TaxID=2602767 RepID=A0A5C7FZN4_9BACT|nr:heparinase II/III family protein [Neolewinella aurantiaca]TXF91166.1 alginate lyase family protein [Neolewinella aurantiaca]
MIIRNHIFICIIALLFAACTSPAEEKNTDTLFEQELARTQVRVDAIMEQGVNVPVPKDMAGGYTHEEHKRNWSTLCDAGALFTHTGDKRYATFIRDVLFEYAELYPTLPRHPTNRSYATGKLFWQCLNDANWLVYVSHAYDDIYDWLPEEERKQLNEQLFRPMADFLSVETPQFFNRIHNHSTWACAAVGMIGLVMDDDELVDRALNGLPPESLPDDLRDNDSGLIKDKYGRAGFLPQLDLSFSPDGYFAEGPYYLRYALSPFLFFGEALDEKRPGLNILEYRDGILGKAINALVLQADPTGDFFPINDSHKGMSLYSDEVVKSVDYGYYLYGNDPSLLTLAEKQGTVSLNAAGKAVSDAVAAGKAEPFRPTSVLFTDGADGKEGGVAVIRAYGAEEDHASVFLFKYAAQGMGHGHFDRLGYSFYNERGEVIQDYGSARWVNIDQKGGGRYLKENNTWAKQTVAHNALVVNQTSHFDGEISKAENFHPNLYAADISNPDFQLVSATENNAYPGREMHRSMWLLKDDAFQEPLLISVLRTSGSASASFDLPLWYKGQMLENNCDCEINNVMKPLGTNHGYQHLWAEANCKPKEGQLQFNWFHNGRFFTQTSVTDAEDEVLLVRLGANDPEMNLRRAPGLIHRRNGRANATFISVLETHGSYTPRNEIPHDPYGHITDLNLVVDSPEYTGLSFNHQDGTQWMILISNQNADPSVSHNLNINGRAYNWQGVHHLIKTNNNESK